MQQSRRKICVFTGSRAEYGLLEILMKEIKSDSRLLLQIIVSGAHLEKGFGETWHQIINDGFSIDAKVDVGLTSSSPLNVARSMAQGLGGCAQALDQLKPDLIVIVGDRYEALAVAAAATVLQIPIAHIHGGEITNGAIDELFRHAITKLSYFHFVAAEPYFQRVVQMGEHPSRVFLVGAPGLDQIASRPLLTRDEIELDLKFKFKEKNLLVTYHPETASKSDSGRVVETLIGVLNEFSDIGVIITGSNADAGGAIINDKLCDYAFAYADRVRFFYSLGQQLYLSIMAQVDAVIGNSSSGIIEAPAMGKPNVNIGQRQDGRIRAQANIDCDNNKEKIQQAINWALSSTAKKLAASRETPYGTPGASKKIKNILAIEPLDTMKQKIFYDIEI